MLSLRKTSVPSFSTPKYYSFMIAYIAMYIFLRFYKAYTLLLYRDEATLLLNAYKSLFYKNKTLCFINNEFYGHEFKGEYCFIICLSRLLRSILLGLILSLISIKLLLNRQTRLLLIYFLICIWTPILIRRLRLSIISV